MLTFHFEPVGHEAVIDGLTWGHITVKGEEAEYSSTNTAQPTYLLMAILELLSGVLKLLTHPKEKQYIFEPIYGDYMIKVFQTRHKVLSVYALRNKEQLIARTSPEQLRLALWQGVEHMLSQYRLSDESDGNDDATVVGVEERQELDSLLQKWVAAFPELPPITVI